MRIADRLAAVAVALPFMKRKQEAQERFGDRKKAVEKHRRLNRALRVGHVVPVVVELLNRLAESQLGEHFRVVGTHALYAYEAAASVRFDDGALANGIQFARREGTEAYIGPYLSTGSARHMVLSIVLPRYVTLGPMGKLNG